MLLRSDALPCRDVHVWSHPRNQMFATPVAMIPAASNHLLASLESREAKRIRHLQTLACEAAVRKPHGFAQLGDPEP